MKIHFNICISQFETFTFPRVTPPPVNLTFFDFQFVPIPQAKNSTQVPNLGVILGEQIPLPLSLYSRSPGHTNKSNTRGMP